MSPVLKLRVAGVDRILKGQDHFWSVIRDLTEKDMSTPFSVKDVAGLCAGGQKPSVGDFIRRLVAGGIAEKLTTKDDKGEIQFRLVSRPRKRPVLRRDGTKAKTAPGQQQMWNVLRRNRDGVTARSLSVEASTDDHVVARNTALKYCRALEAAGMLTVLRKGGAAVEQLWRLKGSANTGPKAPLILRTQMVFDQNSGKIIGEPVAEEERI